jgi:cell wall assembly regulator SMI1
LSVRGAITQRSRFAARAPRYDGYVEEPLPFAAFGGGSLVLLVDASPTVHGRSGQIIAFTHDPDQITYVGAAFPEYLAASLSWFEEKRDELLDLE